MSKLVLALISFVFLSHAWAAPALKHEPFPSHWWTPVAREGAPSWEILPQEAGPGEVILSKRNELGLLSNFAATPFEFRGKKYASVEGFWQAMLYPENANDPRATFPGIQWKHSRAEVEQMVAFEAKTAGDLASENMLKMKIDWATFEGKRFTYYTPGEKGEQYRLVVSAMREKLAQNPRVKEVLMATRGLKLRPDHHQPADAPPSWRYHEIWMELRDESSSKHPSKHLGVAK